MLSDKVTRFPTADPSKAENFKTGIVNSGLNIDSQGNVWVTNRFGDGLLGMSHLVDMAVRLKLEGIESATECLIRTMSKQHGRDGSATLMRPDGTQYPGSPFMGGGLPGLWAVVVDGNDNVCCVRLGNSMMPRRQRSSSATLPTARWSRRDGACRGCRSSVVANA